MQEVTNSKGEVKQKLLTRFDIADKYEQGDYPISLAAWDSYKKTLSKNARTGTTVMSIESLYKICIYTGVSADYMLGFIGSKYKHHTAEAVRKEFGLTDESMEKLLELNYQIVGRYHATRGIKLPDDKKRTKQFSGAQYVNLIITHFMQEFAEYLHDYFKMLLKLEDYSEPNGTPKKELEKYDGKMISEEEILDTYNKLNESIAYHKSKIIGFMDNFLELAKQELYKSNGQTKQ